MTDPSPEARREFFAWTESLDYEVLRPLSHARGNWELTWDHDALRYRAEDDSFAKDLNDLIDCIATTPRPARYHDNEDVIANYLASEGSNIRKEKGRWVGDDYEQILANGGFSDIDQEQLRIAATGRVCAAIEHGQMSYDQMENGHRKMLASILTIILYHGTEL